MKKNILKVIYCVWLFLCSQSVFAELPPEAAESMKRGFSAASQKDYLQAINFFEEARKIVPEAPEVYYNLGLAESQISGRELRAIAYFGTYLVAKPDTSNTAAIREQIDLLDKRSLNTLASLMKFWSDSCEKMDKDDSNRDDTLWRTADMWANAGDLARAQEAASRMAYPNDRAIYAIALLQIKQGDYTGARETSKRIQSKRWTLDADFEIAIAQRLKGDIAGSDQTIAQAKIDPEYPDRLKYVQVNADYKIEERQRAQNSSLANWLDLFDPKSSFSLEVPLFKDVEGYMKSLLQPVYVDGQQVPEYAPGVFRRQLEEDIRSVINMHSHVMEMLKK